MATERLSSGTEEHQIIIIDDLAPEDIAMLQAMYSRDPRSVLVHLERVKRLGSGEFMNEFYVGYNHDSIGDCGTTTLFVEQVSMLEAKCIQHWPLYSGQESSTRFLDFSGRVILNPLGTPEGASIHDRAMKLYYRALDVLIPYLKKKYQITDEELASAKKASNYEKAIKAKAFDIARSFLPAGMTTMASWHTNLRQAADHIKVMRHHPLAEMRKVASEMLEALRVKYPNSFSHEIRPEEEAYIAQCRGLIEYNYADLEGPAFSSHFKLDVLDRFWPIIKNRPPRALLPQELRKAGDIDYRFLLDFGSWRDLQRHRSMSYLMPLLTTRHGFHPLYLAQLPVAFCEEVEEELLSITRAIKRLNCDEPTRQYYIPMGFRVVCDITCNLPSAVYIAELRSKQDVHFTLRPVAQQMARALARCIPGITLHNDTSPDKWSTRRGTQDITKK